ncbi:MAG: hypothetical protein ACTSRG_22360 [Candidatus Helarchaeota archaeon]
MKNNNSEKIFANLCEYTYLSGFTFHSPKIYDPTEKELCDILIWARTQLFVFEVIWRSNSNKSTKSFIKRIGEKRDQLRKDFKLFQSGKEIIMTNKSGRVLVYKPEYFISGNFFGIIIIDCDNHLHKMHYGTLEKTLNSPFPIAIMLKSDFEFILNEVDTTSDLKYYLYDRYQFFKQVYKQTANFFLDLNLSHEKQLLGFYKINNYHFPIEEWDPDFDYWHEFQTRHSNQVNLRDQENKASKVVDKLIDTIMESGVNEIPLVHAWQLAVIPRRARAGWFADRIIDAIDKMISGKKHRHFALKNEITGCWLVFYFQYGGSREDLIQKIEELTKLKLVFEMTYNDFNNSVIGYGFRKSNIITEYIFDDVVLLIEDASDYSKFTESMIAESKKYFRGITSAHKVTELPEK